MDEEVMEQGIQAQADAGAPGAGIMSGLGLPVSGNVMQQQQPQNFSYGVSAPTGYESIMPMQQQQMLPRAILAQYPTLGGIWNDLPSNGPDEIDDGGMPGRGSFSSAGEYDEDEWSGSNQGPALGWASDVGP
jgi:hypothetical protein